MLFRGFIYKVKNSIIIIILTFIYPQTSVLDLNGQGKMCYNFDPAAISVGDSWLFSCNFNNNTINSLSSMVGQKQATLRMFTSFNRVLISNQVEQNDQSINLLSFTFPISNMSILSFGLTPLTKSNFNIIDSNFSLVPGNELSDPVAYSNRYDINGGISQFYIAMASQRSNRFSLGLKWQKLFGNQFFNNKNYTYSITYNQLEVPDYTLVDSTISETDRNYNGSNIELDCRFFINEKSTVALVTNFSLHTSITQSYRVLWDAPNGQRLIISSEDKKLKLNKFNIRSFALGYSQLLIKNKLRFNLEYHYSNPITYDNEFMIFGQDPPKYNSLHAGISKEIYLSQTNIINSLSLGLGGSAKKIKINNDDVYDLNISFGISLDYAKNSNKLDLSFQIGNIVNPIENINSEKYINVNLGIIAGDVWFMENRRND